MKLFARCCEWTTKSLLAAVISTATLSSSAAGATYSYSKLSDNTSEYPSRYVDTVAQADYLMGLGEVFNGVSSYIQPVSDTTPSFGDRIDLGLGVYESPYYPAAHSFASADIDGDGEQDYVVKNTDLNGTYLNIYYTNRPDVRVPLSAPGSSCNTPIGPVFWESDRNDQPVIADINHDGLVDITVISGCSVFSIDEDGYTNPGWPLTNKPFQKLNLVDLNADGNTDLLITSDQLLQAIRGDGTEIWHRNYSGTIYYPAIGNVDGGSDREIVVSANNFEVLRLDGSVKWSDPWVAGSPTPFTTVRLCDIDGDNQLDLITQLGGFVTGGSKIYAYHLSGSRTLFSGFPVQLPGNISQGGFLCANLTKSPGGNDLLAPTDSGLVVIGHQSPSILYTIGSGSVTDLLLGTTDGTNLVALANFGNNQEVYQFTANGQAAVKADLNPANILQQNNDNQRTGNPDGAPLRQGTPVRQADINHDGSVNVFDLSIILNYWHSSGAGDLDNNGTVNIYDLSRLLNAWTG